MCIGSDGVYQILDLEWMQAQFAMMKEKLDPDGRIGARFPDQPLELNTPRRMEVLEAEFWKRGYSERVICKVMGANLIGFFAKNLR